jgi:hypothetical protein
MLEKYTKEEINKIYEELPDNLKDVLFSEETSKNIYNSCKENDLNEEKMKEVSTLVGEIILGITSINDLEKNIVRDLEISIDKAKSISGEISRFVLSPVKEEIEQVFKKNTNKEVNDEDIPDRPEKKDIYREPIE